MALSALGFSVMMVFVKRQSASIPQFELVFFRSFINFIVQLGIVIAFKQAIFPSDHKRLLVFRGLAGFLGMTCLFFAIRLLPVSIAAVVNWLSPVFVILFSWLFLRETVTIGTLGWVGLVFIGVFLLLNPDFSGATHDLPLAGVVIALLGAAFGGMAYVAVRAATAQVGVHVIILYFAGIASLLALPLALANFKTPSGPELFELILLGLSATVGQFAMTQGYRFAAAGIVSAMSLLNAAFSVLLGWILFQETLGIGQWGGLLLIALGISAITLRNQSLPKTIR